MKMNAKSLLSLHAKTHLVLKLDRFYFLLWANAIFCGCFLFFKWLTVDTISEAYYTAALIEKGEFWILQRKTKFHVILSLEGKWWYLKTVRCLPSVVTRINKLLRRHRIMTLCVTLKHWGKHTINLFKMVWTYHVYETRDGFIAWVYVFMWIICNGKVYSLPYHRRQSPLDRSINFSEPKSVGPLLYKRSWWIDVRISCLNRVRENCSSWENGKTFYCVDFCDFNSGACISSRVTASTATQSGSWEK